MNFSLNPRSHKSQDAGLSFNRTSNSSGRKTATPFIRGSFCQAFMKLIGCCSRVSTKKSNHEKGPRDKNLNDFVNSQFDKYVKGTDKGTDGNRSPVTAALNDRIEAAMKNGPVSLKELTEITQGFLRELGDVNKKVSTD